MSDSNRYSTSQGWRVTITLHPVYGGKVGTWTLTKSATNSRANPYTTNPIYEYLTNKQYSNYSV